MDNIISETTDTGGKVVVPIQAVIDGNTELGDVIRQYIKDAGEKVGKSKVRLSQMYDADEEAYIVEWTWA